MIHLFCILFSLSSAWAWTPELNLPSVAPVVDEVGLLSASDKTQLQTLALEIKKSTGVELTVFVASSLRDLPIEQFALGVAEQWGLGKKKSDKGLLFLIAPNQKKMRLEVGYGLEGDLTDAFTRRVLDEQARPHFRSGNFYQGIYSSLVAIQSKVPLGLDPNLADDPAVRLIKLTPLQIILLFMVVIFFLSLFLGTSTGYRHRYRGHDSWGGGGFGGGSWGGGSSGGFGSWGGGGGGFGGGGASSDW